MPSEPYVDPYGLSGGTPADTTTPAAGGTTDWTAMLKKILSGLGGTLGTTIGNTADSAVKMAPLLFLAEYLQKQADKSGMKVPEALAANEAMRDRYWTGMQAAGPQAAGHAPAPFNPYPKETTTTSGVNPQVVQMASQMASGQQPTLQAGQNLLSNTMALRGGMRAPRTGQVSGIQSQLPLPAGATPLYGENASGVRPLAGGSAAIQGAWKTFNQGNADPGYTAGITRDTTRLLTSAVDDSLLHYGLTATNDSTTKTTYGTPFDMTDGQYNGKTVYAKAHENLIFGNVCFMNTDGEYALALADTSITMPGCVVALASISANAYGMFLQEGYVCEADWTTVQTKGALVYVSGATPGLPDTTAPTTTRHNVEVIGYCIGTDIFFFRPDWTLVVIP